jgi:predicted nucleic acid-binding protein
MNIFLDTNVLVYSFDHRYPAKREKARVLLQTLKTGPDHAVISTQVMQETYNTLTQKLSVSPEDAAAELNVLMALDIVAVVPDLILAAAALHASASLSFWDALVIAAAQSAECDELWSEDLQTGRSFGRLRIVNPFAGL